MRKRSERPAAYSITVFLGFAWDGIDSDTGGAVEIGTGNLVRSGQTIEISHRSDSDLTIIQISVKPARTVE